MTRSLQKAAIYVYENDSFLQVVFVPPGADLGGVPGFQKLDLRCIAPISICLVSFAVLNISHGNRILFHLHKQGISEDKVLSSLETLSIL